MNLYLTIITAMFTSFMLCIGLLLFYLKFKKNLLHQKFQLQEAEIQYQKSLLSATINSQEQERKRIGMDLHDEVGSTLSALRLMIENHDTDTNNDGTNLQSLKSTTKSAIDNIITSVRNISHNLSPILKGAYGFDDALYDLIDRINATGKIEIILDTNDAAEEVQMNQLTSLGIYRVISELINNSIKHAQASKIDILFNVDDGKVLIQYEDNGIGMDMNQIRLNKGIGLKNIESRLNTINAQYQYTTAPGKGFKLFINFTLEPEP